MATFFRSFLSTDEANSFTQCCECGNIHRKGDRIDVKKSLGVFKFVCPECNEESYYSLKKENTALIDAIKCIPIHEHDEDGEAMYLKSDVEEMVLKLLLG